MQVSGLYRFPVKGLSAEALPEVELAAGHGFPMDRTYAVTDGSLVFDAANPVPAPKTQFLMLARYEALATLRTRLAEDRTLIVQTRDGQERSFAIEEADGRDALAAFLADCVGVPLPGRPEVVSARGHRFTDVSVHSQALMQSISLINVDTVDALSSTVGTALDALRFRGNLLFTGAPPWSELEWVGRRLRVGAVLLRVVRRTKRCAATSVNVMTGERDVNVPLRIRQATGHGDLGVYAEVIEGGKIAAGDEMALVEE